jgi:hypothetical protein
MNFITGRDVGADTGDTDQQVRPVDSNIAPETDAVIDVGSKNKRFRNGSFVTTTVRIDSIDMSGVNPDSAKGTVSTGVVVELETDESISAGELMMYMSDSYGELKCKSLDSDVAPQHLFAGVAIGDTLPGGVVQIMNKGLTTCAFVSSLPTGAFTVGMAKVNPSHQAGQTIGYYEGYFGSDLLRVEAATPWTDNNVRPTVWSVKVNGAEIAVVDENTLPQGSLLAPLADRAVGGTYRLTLSDLSIDNESIGGNGVGLPVSLFQSLYATGTGAGNVRASTLASVTNTRIGFTVGSNTDGQKVFMMVE